MNWIPLIFPPSTTTLVNSVFSNHDSYGATAQAKWKQNIGVTTGSDVVQTGVAGMGISSYDAPAINRDTYGILLENKATTSGDIIFYYTVKARATNRTEKTADISIAITVKLKEATAIFGSSNALKAKIMIGGVWQEVYLKKSRGNMVWKHRLYDKRNILNWKLKLRSYYIIWDKV